MAIYGFAENSARDYSLEGDVGKENPERPLESYSLEELTKMLHEATKDVQKSIERRNSIREAIDRKHMQFSEGIAEADHQFTSVFHQTVDSTIAGPVPAPRSY